MLLDWTGHYVSFVDGISMLLMPKCSVSPLDRMRNAEPERKLFYYRIKS